MLNIVGSQIARVLRLPALHLEADAAKCRGCKSCGRACPKSLPIGEWVQEGAPGHTECILCGSCVDSCRYGAVRYGFRREAAVQGNLAPQCQVQG